MLNVNRYDDAKRFYEWLMPKIGYPKMTAYAEGARKRGTGWSNGHGAVCVQEAERPFRADEFHRHRVGLCELAFTADSRAQIDRLATEIEQHGGKITNPPREYDYSAGYYALFFTDPDGIKLELVHTPE
jgi:catechol 2,3-dioxygenase-like lactoylglutathione lyase family enzyme